MQWKNTNIEFFKDMRHTFRSAHSCGLCANDSSRSGNNCGTIAEVADLARVNTKPAMIAATPRNADPAMVVFDNVDNDDGTGSELNLRMKVCPRVLSELGSSQSSVGGPEIADSARMGDALWSANRHKFGNITVKCLHPSVSRHCCWQAKTTSSRSPASTDDVVISGDQVTPISMHRKRFGT